MSTPAYTFDTSNKLVIPSSVTKQQYPTYDIITYSSTMQLSSSTIANPIGELEDGSKSNMHKVWDGQIIEYAESVMGKDQFHQGVREKITMLLDQPQPSQIEVWAQESRDLAMSDSVGYRGNTLEFASTDYMQQHIDITQERIALAAIRLSQALSSSFAANK